MAGLVGIDVGGTFTDLCYSGDATRSHQILKVPSTPQDPSIGLIESLRAAGLGVGELDAILHGTTIATNAVIERRGARCALVTTRGFRDLIELGRRDRPSMYGLEGTHEPMVPRDLRFEVDERLDHEGKVVRALDEAGLRQVGAALKELDVESVVISFMHAYANTAHEDRARAILAEINPHWELVTATSVVREYYEFERTSTAVVQGYLQPLVARYAKNLARKLRDWGFEREVAIMQSNGGVAPLRQLGARAADIVRSGPAAGVTAAARIAAEAGFSHVITGDMMAMANMFSVGQRGVAALVKRYGRGLLSDCLNEMIKYSERQMRSYIAELPDGSYSYEDVIDNDGIVDKPMRVALSITVKGESMHFDFAGTGPKAPGPMNMSRNTTLSLVYVAIKHIFPDVSVNRGTFRPISFNIPTGTMLAAEYPSPCGGYLEPMGRVIDVVFGAMSKVLPDKAPVAFFGTIGVVSISGTHPRSGNYFVGVFPYPGVNGGGPALASKVEFVTGGKSWVPEMRSKQEKEPLHAGDALRAASPGGGGFGKALERDLAAVEHDLNLGYIRLETAETVYGAVIAEAKQGAAGNMRYRLDEAASTQRRQQLLAKATA